MKFPDRFGCSTIYAAYLQLPPLLYLEKLALHLTLFHVSLGYAGIKIDETYKTYTRGDALDIYLKNGTGDSRYIAQVWPGATNMPDFFHPNAQQWWSQEVADFHQLIPFDGLWLDMNEPANFCSGPNCYYDPNRKCPELIYECCMICNNDEGLSRWDDPPYTINSFGTKRPLYKSTVAMNALHYNGVRMYDTHNIYGMSEGLATYNALKEVCSLIPYFFCIM